MVISPFPYFQSVYNPVRYGRSFYISSVVNVINVINVIKREALYDFEITE